MFQTDDPLAIPLWVDGHAYLTMAPSFLDVCNPVSGEVLRRTPLCGARETHRAIAAAQAALAPWAAQTTKARAVLLFALGGLVTGYAGHFAKLIIEETGKAAADADAEVSRAVALLRGAVAGDAKGVSCIVGDRNLPLLGSLRLAAPALLAGAAIVIKPSPETPSAIFALAELTGRCGFPEGVFNILHGGEATVEALRAARGISLLFS